MRASFVLPVLLMVILPAAGCGKAGNNPVDTPEKRQELARKSGEAAALGYLAIDKPDDETAVAIKAIVDKVEANLEGWREGGFISALPELEKTADALFPGEERKGERVAAKKLVKMLLEELDNLFDEHPEWKDKGDEVAAIVAAFANGASQGFDEYLQA